MKLSSLLSTQLLALGFLLIGTSSLVWSQSACRPSADTVCAILQRLTTLESEVVTLQNDLAALQEQVNDLTQPSSVTVVFALNRPQPFTTDPMAVSGGWTKMTISVGTTGTLCTYSMLIPSGGVWVEQVRIGCDCGAQCPVVTIPMISDFYRFSTGTASGSITAAAVLEK